MSITHTYKYVCMFMWMLHFRISHFRELMCHTENSAWINKKINSMERPRKTIILNKLCVLVCPSAGNMSSKQACNTLVEDCPNLSKTLGQDTQEEQNCPWKKRELGVLSDTFRMLLYLPLSTDVDNRRATKSAEGTSNLCIVAQVLCTGLCLAVLFSINVNHIPCLRTPDLLPTLFFLPTHLWPFSLSSLLTLLQEREQTSWLSPPAGVAPLLVRDDN